MLIVISWFSVAGTQDYMSWNKARWSVIPSLIEDKNSGEIENEPTLSSVEKTKPNNSIEVVNESEEEVKPIHSELSICPRQR